MAEEQGKLCVIERNKKKCLAKLLTGNLERRIYVGSHCSFHSSTPPNEQIPDLGTSKSLPRFCAVGPSLSTFYGRIFWIEQGRDGAEVATATEMADSVQYVTHVSFSRADELLQ